ncbi:uncharacterized protein [Gossypium hirsutum]|uniref:Copia protein n=1 Tax=Gossypium hirsutum TaxID=3635 RepID=A0A1U8ILU8_GOSHI|nr:uncharacterized protein LOC107898034 [Gossypium hirsutum]
MALREASMSPIFILNSKVEDGIFVSQKKYAADLLKKFNMLRCKTTTTPMNVNENLKIDDGTKVHALSIKASLWRCKTSLTIEEARQVMSLVLDQLLSIGVPKKQATAALSSSEAEHTTITSSACQGLWLGRILADVNMKQKEATVIYCDNQAVISMSKNPSFHGRTKHINIRVYLIRDLVSDGSIIPKYCNTNEQVANILTKSLPREKHAYFRLQLGVCNFESRGSVGE